MGQTNNSLRVHTQIGSQTDSYLTVNLEQNYETIDILSLKIDQKGAYRYHVSDYGVIVGRVLANNGFGVPNARLSLFVEKNDTTDIVKDMLYPYENSISKNVDGIRYNLLPDRQRDDCHQIVGTFPSKRLVLDDNNMLEVFDEYYKYTTRTNDAGDYMFFGIPTGTYTLHMDLDISDCGKLSQRPRDFIYKGYTIEQFENPNQFKIDTELSSLSQIFTQDTTIEVKPFWGDSKEGTQIGITRKDIDVSFKFEPTCVFMGSIVTDNPDEGISVKCVPSNRMGEMNSLTTGPGRIEIIRKKIDNTVEELQIKGTQLINGNGVWCFQIPMNLDYVITDEYGNMVPTDNPEKGIPTRCEVRFRLSLDEPNPDTVTYHRGKVLVPHNPNTENELDYNFGSATKDTSFKSLMWNNVYTIKSFIPRFQKARNILTDKFTGIKKVNMHGSNNPIPYNNIRVRIPFMFWLLCNIIKLFIRIVGMINNFKVMVMRVVGNLADITLPYSYISNELCPDLENWYFAPGIVTSPTTKRNNRTCRQWENQSVCETFKEIGKDLSPTSISGVTYYKLKTEKFYGDTNRISGTTVKVTVKDGAEPVEEKVLFEYITNSELEKLNTETATTLEYSILNKEGYEEVLSITNVNKSVKDLYVTASIEEVQKYASQDSKSIDVQNSLDNSEVRINLTSSTNYLMECVEINLAQEYEVIKFDFYNDWINGCVYLPRWARNVKYKKKRKKGNTIITERVKGCINDVKKSRVSRRYVQQCSLSYDDKGNVTTNIGCHDDKLRCHKKDGMSILPVMGVKSGIVSEHKTSLGDYVYYLKPYEFQPSVRVPFFATDIVMLGTLLDCNEYGLPSTFDSLVSTTYQLPPQLAMTNVDNDTEQYFDLSSGAPTPQEVSGWSCNAKCNKGGRMVVGRINTEGVVKKTPSYSDLDAIIAEAEIQSTEKVKYVRVNKDEYQLTQKDGKGGLWQKDGEGNPVPANTVFYDVDGNNWYYTDEKCENPWKEINSGDTITIYYKKVSTGEPTTLEFEDLFPVTEMSGIDWSYEGVGYSGITTTEKMLSPGGLFLGLSCSNAETNIKSCVNLKRACEIGTSLSTRIEIPIGINNSEDNNDLQFDMVNYLYVAPNGLIAKDQIVDPTFRSAFATMNQNSLSTKENEVGYKVYDFAYLLPDSFDGSLMNKISGYTRDINNDIDAYWGDYVEDLEKQKDNDGITNEITIEAGNTIIRDSETRSDDYVSFRLGKKEHYLLNGNSMPFYKNSFYFYFGLKDGLTALDEFKTQFYAPCSKNIIVEEKGRINIDNIEVKEGFIFQIDYSVEDLEGPFSYELTKTSVGDFRELVKIEETLKTEITEGDEVIVIDKEDSLTSSTEDKFYWSPIETKKYLRGEGTRINGVYPGCYTLKVQDERGNQVFLDFEVGKGYVKPLYEKDTLTNFVGVCPYTGITDINLKNTSYGGYMKGKFSVEQSHGGYFKLTVKRKPNKEDFSENSIEWENIKNGVWTEWYNHEVTNGNFENVDDGGEKFTPWTRWYRSYEKMFYFWKPGDYEIWIRYFDVENDANKWNPKNFKYEYKVDEFTVSASERPTYNICDRQKVEEENDDENNVNSISNEELLSLEQTYGEWWKKSPFTMGGDSIDSDIDLYKLYRIITDYNVFTGKEESGHTIFFDDYNDNVEICYFSQVEDLVEKKLSDEYYYQPGVDKTEPMVLLIGDNINGWEGYRTPLYMVGDDNKTYANISVEVNVGDDGILTSNYPLEYSKFVNYIQKSKTNVMRTHVLVSENGVNRELVRCFIVGDKIQVVPVSETAKNIKSGILVYANKLPVLRRAFSFKYILVIYYGDSTSKTAQGKFINNSVLCFNNEIKVSRSYGENGAAFSFIEKEASDRGLTGETKTFEFPLSGGTVFATTSNYNNGQFTILNQSVCVNNEVLVCRKVCNINVPIENLWSQFDENNVDMNGNENQNAVEMFKIKRGSQEVMVVNILKTV